MTKAEKVEMIDEMTSSLQNGSNAISVAFDEILMNLQINKNDYIDMLKELKKCYRVDDCKQQPSEVENDIDGISKDVIQLQRKWIDHINRRLLELKNLQGGAKKEKE